MMQRRVLSETIKAVDGRWLFQAFMLFACAMRIAGEWLELGPSGVRFTLGAAGCLPTMDAQRIPTSGK
jgi:hypothetical protein